MRTDIDEPDMMRVRPLPWAEFRAEALAHWCYPTVSKHSARQYLVVLDQLELIGLAGEGEPARTVATTADLTSRLAARFKASLPATYSPFTTKQKLMYVQSLCQFAFENRWLSISPFHLRKMAKWIRTGRPAGKRYMTREECRRLLEVLDGDVASRKGWELFRAHRMRIAVLIALHCGLRAMELLRSHAADYDLDARLIRLEPHGRAFKTARSIDTVPIPDAIVPALQEWLRQWRLAAPEGYAVDPACPWMIPGTRRESAWTGGGPGRKPLDQLKLVGKRAGIEGITWQMCRRTCATMLEAAGVSGTMIARILRHSEAVDAAFYRQRDEQSMREAARGLAL